VVLRPELRLSRPPTAHLRERRVLQRRRERQLPLVAAPPRLPHLCGARSVRAQLRGAQRALQLRDLDTSWWHRHAAQGVFDLAVGSRVSLNIDADVTMVAVACHRRHGVLPAAGPDFSVSEGVGNKATSHGASISGRTRGRATNLFSSIS
jgi:hypothetical protein